MVENQNPAVIIPTDFRFSINISASEHNRKLGHQSTSLTFLRYWGKPINLKRVNAHAEQRELSTSVLD